MRRIPYFVFSQVVCALIICKALTTQPKVEREREMSSYNTDKYIIPNTHTERAGSLYFGSQLIQDTLILRRKPNERFFSIENAEFIPNTNSIIGVISSFFSLRFEESSRKLYKKMPIQMRNTANTVKLQGKYREILLHDSN